MQMCGFLGEWIQFPTTTYSSNYMAKTCTSIFSDQAMLIAVGKVNNQSNNQPY
jgi:hypothetical protein